MLRAYSTFFSNAMNVICVESGCWKNKGCVCRWHALKGKRRFGAYGNCQCIDKDLAKVAVGRVGKNSIYSCISYYLVEVDQAFGTRR